MRLKYVKQYRDRLGKVRRYVRLKGKPEVPLKSRPGSHKFMQEYYDAINGVVENAEQLARSTKIDAIGVIYFIDGGSLLKIGFSSNFEARLKQYRTHNSSVDLITTIPGTRQDDYEMRKRFAHLKERGDWFRKTKELSAFVTKMKTERGMTIPIFPRSNATKIHTRTTA